MTGKSIWGKQKKSVTITSYSTLESDSIMKNQILIIVCLKRRQNLYKDFIITFVGQENVKNPVNTQSTYNYYNL